MKRCKTDYPGVFYREVKRIGGPGLEKVFYVVFKQNGKVYLAGDLISQAMNGNTLHAVNMEKEKKAN